jgi:arylsulfatase A-like enzyme
VRGLERAGGPWSLVFTADHGESLGEHGYYWEHGDYVYEGTVRVPLAFVPAEGDPLRRAARHREWVSLVDVAPTLVELFDLPVPYDLAYEIEGRSLAPALRGEPLAPRPVFAESDQSYHPEEIAGRVRFDVAGRFRAVWTDRWKLVWTPFQAPEREFALYDLAADPGETRNLWRPDHPELPALRQQLAGWLRASDDQTRTALDAHDVEILRSLGYVE